MPQHSLFATYFDQIFPLNQETLSFLLNHFEKGKTLDLGSATGEYSLALSRKGFDTLGIDIDQDMIDISLEKTKKLSLLARFLRGNCLDVVYLNQFRNIFCIGNTLAHLSSLKEITQSLKHVYESLVDQGTLIIQTINYDRIISGDVKELPLIENNGVSFERKYVIDNDHIHFNTTLKVLNQIEENSALLFPILSDDLLKILKSIGFKNIVNYGSFTMTKYHKDKSYHLVIVAKK